MSRHKARVTGFTLVETMVACVLLGLATTIMATFLVDFSRQAARYENRQQLVLGAEKVIMRLVDQLSDSRASLVTADSTIAGVYFPVADSPSDSTVRFDSSGNVIWQRWMAWGFNSTAATVYESQLPLASPTNDASILLKSLTSLPSSWTRKTWATQVQSFSVTGPVSSAFRVRLLVKDSHGYLVEMASTAVARN
jgi:type II secretory pathway pseudopilin PulG